MGRSRGYSGSATFNFTVERIQDKISGEYYLEEELEDVSSSEFESKFEFTSVELEVTGNSWYVPGEYSRLPEDCYPDEGDTEVESVIGPDDTDWYDQLTSKEIQEMYSELEERCKDNY